MCQASRLSSKNSEANIMPMPYRASMARMKTVKSCGKLTTLYCTLKIRLPSRVIARARRAVATMPPRAMPSRMAIIELGAMMNKARLPCSFSQYNWLDMLHSTLTQKAVMAPPMTTKPT